MTDVLTHTLDLGRLVPVVTISDAASANDLADALVAGGIRAIEITLRTPAALDAIAALEGRSDLAVGVGTVVAPDQVDAAADRGATFAVSPGLDAAVVERTVERGLTPLPGVATASELQQALRLGLGAVKVFPAAQLGGPAFIQALAGPFPQVRFMPSGGVSPANVGEFLRVPAVFAVGTSWIAATELIASRDFDRIAELAADAVARLP